MLVQQQGCRHHTDTGHQQGEGSHLRYRIAHQQPPPQTVAEPSGDKREIEHAQETLPADIEQAACHQFRSLEQPGECEEGEDGHHSAPGDKARQGGLIAQPDLAIDDVAKAPAGGRAEGQHEAE